MQILKVVAMGVVEVSGTFFGQRGPTHKPATPPIIDCLPCIILHRMPWLWLLGLYHLLPWCTTYHCTPVH
jgi:hypothetical protein